MLLKRCIINLLLCTCIIICSISLAAAQSGPINYDKNVLVPKPTVIKSSATGNYAERNITVKVWVEKDPELGYKVFYKASKLLENVVVTRSNPVMEKQAILHNGNEDNGWVALETGAYMGSKNYTFTFFVKSLPEPVWITEIEIKKQNFIIKTFPKKHNSLIN